MTQIHHTLCYVCAIIKKWHNTKCELMRKSYFKRKHKLIKTVPICEAVDLQLIEVFKHYKKRLKSVF